MKRRYQVVIVGGGPVGVALAIDLGQRGLSCALVERRLAPQRIPKGQALTQRSMEHLYFWGVADKVRAARLLPPDFPTSGVTDYRNLMSAYWYAPRLRGIVNRYYFQQQERLPQYLTEDVLRTRMAQLPDVEAMFGWTARTVTQDDHGVRIAIHEENGSGEQTLEADYVVGCDGGHSTVRESIGIARDGTDFDQLMVLAVLRSRELNEGLKRFPPASTFRAMHPDLKGYWMFFGRVDEGESFFFHAPVPPDTTRDNYDFQSLLERVAGFRFSCTFDYVGFWDLRISVAETYQVGRVFIAGDAAHSHPPYGGYGLNSGLDDVANLGWKLAARIKGWGGDALLASYSEERRPVFKETAAQFIEARIRSDRELLDRATPESDRDAFERAWKEMEGGAATRALTYEPHYEGSPVMFGPPGAASSAHGNHTFKVRAGHHLPSRHLSTGRNVFEALGPEFSLLALDAAAVAAFERAAGAIGVPLTVVRDDASGERADYEARLVLVRPDRYVAWAGDSAPGDAQAILRKAVGQAV